jgi:hypothetical protein
MEHWKTRALMLQACTTFAMDGDKGDDGLEDFGIQCFKRLMSIEIALAKVCRLAKVDAETLMAFACIVGFKPLPEYADPDLVKEYEFTFSGILNIGG